MVGSFLDYLIFQEKYLGYDDEQQGFKKSFSLKILCLNGELDEKVHPTPIANSTPNPARNLNYNASFPFVSLSL